MPETGHFAAILPESLPARAPAGTMAQYAKQSAGLIIQ
jgi:hypothetical protein